MSSLAGGAWLAGTATEWVSSTAVEAVPGTANAEDDNAAGTLMTATFEEEEERDDDPVANGEPRLVELTQLDEGAVVWSLSAFDRPVSDPVVEQPSPPPRA
ncbi:hypothetical protein [Pendulispora albinea]|uniref:Secreted protein n=1 Tax=Pendulispora albinea TaxID=2741071 RepID=A0ABZ2M2G8_9BACT